MPLPEDSLDELIGWYHELTAHSLEEVERLATSETLSRLNSLFETLLTDFQPAIDDAGGAELVRNLHAIRANEKAWNQALCAALIAADGMYSAGDSFGACERLNSFADLCPWKHFKNVARRQLTGYTSGHRD